MTRPSDLAAALLRVYAQALSASGWAVLAGEVLTLAQNLEHRPPSAAQLGALHAAGLVTPAGTLTPDGWAALARVLDGAAAPGGER